MSATGWFIIGSLGFIVGVVSTFILILCVMALGQSAKRGDRQAEQAAQEEHRRAQAEARRIVSDLGFDVSSIDVAPIDPPMKGDSA